MEPTRTNHRQDTDYGRYGRLAFEGLLLALCGYLIGVAGLPPLFGPPGESNGSTEMVAAGVASDSDVAAPTAGAVRVGRGAETEAEAEADPELNMTPGAGVPVTIGRANWTTGYFQAAVFKTLLEELGYSVSEPSANEYAPAEAYRLMADGQFDFWTNSWYPNHQPLVESEGLTDTISPIGNLMPASGLEGIVVTSSTVAENQITSLAQINDDPGLIALFDPDGNGKANIYGCPDGWGCAAIIEETLQFNDWTNLEQIQDDYGTMVSESVAKVDAGTPVLQYTWSPSGYLTSLRPGDNVLWLDLGGQSNVLDGSITPDRDFNDVEPPSLGPACTGDPCWLGWPAADIQVTARNAFLDANPSARVLFDQIELKVLDVALANVLYDTGESTEQDVARHAEEWIADNRALVDQWLTAARSVG